MSPVREAEPRAARSTQARILRAAVGISVATLLVRVLGLVKNQAIAATFGTGDAVEAFLVATVLPTFAIGVLSNSLPSALVPTYVETLRGSGRRAARALVAEVSGGSAVVLAAVTLVLWAAWTPFLALVGAEFSPEKRALATRLFHLFLPVLLLHGVAAVWSAVLNAEKRFLAAVLAPGVVPLATALAALLAAPELGAQALVLGHVGGVALELVWVALAARRAGLSLALAWPTRGSGVLRVLGQYWPVLGGGLLMRSTTVVDQSMAATLPSGSLAALGYASATIGAALSIGAAGLATAILPYLSDMAAAGDIAAIRRSLRATTRLVLAVSIPATALVVWLAEPLVSLLFERGRFDADDARAVGWILAMYALQSPFYAIGMLCARVLSSLRANHLILWVAAANLVSNVVFNLALMPFLGAAGIALSTSLVYLGSALLLGLAVARRLRAAGASG